jgi:hypothetical protein
MKEPGIDQPGAIFEQLAVRWAEWVHDRVYERLANGRVVRFYDEIDRL